MSVIPEHMIDFSLQGEIKKNNNLKFKNYLRLVWLKFKATSKAGDDWPSFIQWFKVRLISSLQLSSQLRFYCMHTMYKCIIIQTVDNNTDYKNKDNTKTISNDIILVFSYI